MKDIDRRLPLQLQCSYQGQQGDVRQSVRGNYIAIFILPEQVLVIFRIPAVLTRTSSLLSIPRRPLYRCTAGALFASSSNVSIYGTNGFANNSASAFGGE